MTQNQSDPWWNREILVRDIVKDLLTPLRKEKVPEEFVLIHNKALEELNRLAITAQNIDNEKFGSPEFLLFVKIKICITRGLGVYKGLGPSIELLQFAIEAKDSYLKIEQTELRYRSTKQQEFYNYIIELLGKKLHKDQFNTLVKQKLNETLPLIKTEEGKRGLQAYAKVMDSLSQHELGLRLLGLFKQYNLADYSILRTIAELVQNFQKEDLRDPKKLVVTVKLNGEAFEKVGRIIGIHESKNKPETYARIIQYIAMLQKHEKSYAQFEDLVKLLKEWQKAFESVGAIREEYNVHEYKQPKEFKQDVPGLELYQKYKEYFAQG